MKWLATCLIALLALGVSSLFLGSGEISPAAVGHWLLGQPIEDSARFILEGLRLPRTLVCMSVGASLGLAGALLQTLLKNPLAEPYTLGLSGGASLGAVIAILLQLQPLWLSTPILATIGCLLATIFVLGMNGEQTVRSKTLILSGVMVSLFSGSFVILILTWLEPFQIQSALFWMMGQVGTERDTWWPLSWIVFLVIFAFILTRCKELDLLLLGEEISQTRGLRLKSFQMTIVIVVAILCSTSVAIAGLIGFVGLLSPHMALLISRNNRHRIFTSLSAIIGACLMLLADLFGRVLVIDRELPAGGLIALIGAPFLIFLLKKRAGHV